MNDFSFKSFLVVITIAGCWAGPVSKTRNGERRDNCSTIELPCWTLSGKCYCFSTDTTTANRIDWNGANKFCKGAGMDLISLDTEEEDQMISDHIKGTSDPELNNDYYWTSGRYSQEGKNRWEWANTQPYQPMTYTNWFPGYPNNSQPGSYAYVNYNFESGFWFNENNPTSTYILFICESIGSMETTTFTPTDAITTEAVTTEVVTTEVVTTEVVTTEVVTTEVVTTEAVTTEAVTTEAVTTEAVTTEVVTTEAVTTEAVTTEAARTEFQQQSPQQQSPQQQKPQQQNP